MNTPLKIANNLLFVLGLVLLTWATISVDKAFFIVGLIYFVLFMPEKPDNKSDFCCGRDTETCTDGYTVSLADLKEYWTLDKPKTKKKTKSKKPKGRSRK